MRADHLCHSSASDAELCAALTEIVFASPGLMDRLRRAREWGLPDWWIASGAVYNQVWNHLTRRRDMYGVKDIDLIHFDKDRSWEAEDRLIRAAARRFPGDPPVELRNQARVHLWYPDRFGAPYPELSLATDAIDHFATITHMVGIRLADDLEIYAPQGLDDIFSFRLAPNTVLDNRETHARKAKRQIALWPELSYVPWPEADR
jgi:hypothetical protein